MGCHTNLYENEARLAKNNLGKYYEAFHMKIVIIICGSK